MGEATELLERRARGATSPSGDVRIVDLSAGAGTKYPQWMVRRAVEILVNNTDRLTVEELQAIADIMLREAGSRVVLGEER